MIFSPRPPNPPGFVELSANAYHTAPSPPPFLFDPSVPSFQPSLKTLQALGDPGVRAVVSPAVARHALAIEQRHARRMDPYGVQFLHETTYNDGVRERIDYDGWPTIMPTLTPFGASDIPCIEMTDASETTADDACGEPMEGIEDTTLVDASRYAFSPTPPLLVKAKEALSPSLYSTSDVTSQPSTLSLRSASLPPLARPHGKDQFSRGRCAICSKASKHHLSSSCPAEYAPLHRRVEDEDGQTFWVSTLEDRPEACCDFNEGLRCSNDCPTDSHWCSLCAQYTHGAQDCPLYFRYVGGGKFESHTRDNYLPNCRPLRRQAPKKIYKTNNFNVNNVNSHTATFGS
ncbi:uncharacterized protein SCHCODRAFT_02495894 [Schizophyllum commune H4-8]|uniref:Expressed protein n=1 Tax=Schizophyllum commune (strain H4-8 / FGSC 9210) TaxID=578458 RepID=D8Q2H8_SCHCM|nr:uncharacterized protein SCHCODRAFT_02495894 [Schizophyllum commune H4-8]KAI5895894.1 hypothetical protein SCHCODRAFT_02495894 [Schizophyllum commune H4-8]